MNFEEMNLAFNKVALKNHPMIEVSNYEKNIQINEAVRYLLALSAFDGTKNKIGERSLKHFFCTFFFSGDLKHFDWRFKTNLNTYILDSREKGILNGICSGSLFDWKYFIVELCSFFSVVKSFGNQLLHHFELMGLGEIWCDYRKVTDANDFYLELKL